MTISVRATSTWLALIMAGLMLVGCGGGDEEPASEQSQASSDTESGMAEVAEPQAVRTSDDQSDSMSQTDSDDMSGEDSDDMSGSDSEAMAQSDSGSGGDQGEDSASSESSGESASDNDAVTVDDDGVAQVTIGATDQMQYTVTAFSVEAGQQVELTLVHEGELPVDAMGHNVVILPAGEDYAAFSQQVTRGGGSLDNDYLPESMREGLIAYTDMLGGGETDTITFTAPEEPGEYPFVCTFPGHFSMMNGVMTVR